ncbi:MAG: SUMF1/EgtB/PvdO family nonheme iron enzyme [Pirellulales bacterium]
MSPFARTAAPYALWFIGVAGAAELVWGVLVWSKPLCAVGAVALSLVALRFSDWSKRRTGVIKQTKAAEVAAVRRAVADTTSSNGDTETLVAQMVAQDRYALLLRSQIISNLTDSQRQHAQRRMLQMDSLVPGGEVVIGPIDDILDEGKLEDHDILARWAKIIEVEPYFLDRYQVTNQQYREFVAAGGYEQLAIWDREVWPAMTDFVDLTGHPGPRYWKKACYAPGDENRPVVGVSWFEATAYARWVGKRLPTDPEWVKAGSWPVVLSPSARLQRKYPWGSAMQPQRANLWGSGLGRAAPVDAYPDGVSISGVYQLIGNVWEWMCCAFTGDGDPERKLVLTVPLKSIRGGAYDTYFEHQATCQFQSGENPLSRKANIGFRCAVGLCDLAPEVSDQLVAEAQDAYEQPGDGAEDDAEFSADDRQEVNA